MQKIVLDYNVVDRKVDCIWKNKSLPMQCLNKNYKGLCTCDLKPCVFYEQKNLVNTLKYKIKNWIKILKCTFKCKKHLR